MSLNLKNGEIAYIVENNRFVRKVTVLKANNDFLTIRIENSNGAIRVRKSRIFTTEKDAAASIKRVPGRLDP